MMYFYDANGFVTTEQHSVGQTAQAPVANLYLPRFINGSWQEGILRRANLFDGDGYYTGAADMVDPRINPNATALPVPAHIILGRFINGEWREGVIGYAAEIDSSGFMVGIKYNLDPRALTENHVLTFPSTTAIAPQYIDGSWVDIGIAIAAVVDGDGYLLGYTEKFDPRVMQDIFTTVLPAQDFIVPRFVNGQWQEAGIHHAWQIDADGFFVSDVFNIDPRNVDYVFTTVELKSATFRKPQLVDGVWVEANPVLPTELLAIAKSSKQAEIANQLSLELAAGVPFLFGENPDVIQTRFERDLINISGITVRAIILNSQGVSDAVIEFRAESNQTYMITPQQAIALGEAVADHSSQAYARSWSAKDAIEHATSVNEIEAIDW